MAWAYGEVEDSGDAADRLAGTPNGIRIIPPMTPEVSENSCPDRSPTETPRIVVNGQSRPLGGVGTVAELVAELGWSDRPCAVELNREVVPRRDHPTARIAAGDRIEIVTLVGGG